MEIKAKKVMIMGGFGEVGFAVAREMLKEKPKELIITSLREIEAKETIDKLSKEKPPETKLIPLYGNIFVRASMKDTPQEKIMSDTSLQKLFIGDMMDELNEEILTSSYLYQIITRHKPEIIVDCINTATSLSYQNIYQIYKGFLKEKKNSKDFNGLKHIFKILSSLSIPPLVRHIQILYESMKRAGTAFYLKIGTTGTGGMGFNIPFTHGEEQPSRLLLSKTAVAGAQTLLLFLLSRTPGGPIIKELKPACLIGWKRIGKGKIFKRGKPIQFFDCPLNSGYQLKLGEKFSFQSMNWGIRIKRKDVEGVFVDTGENGLFSLCEFKVITTLGLMQYITPEEIAKVVLLEIKGVNTSKDILGSIAGAVMGPTYRAGFLRERVIKGMEKLGDVGMAYGLLGPRIAKLILEANLIKMEYKTIQKALNPLPEEMSYILRKLIERDREFRGIAISLGIPILLPDGRTLLFANRGQVDKEWEQEEWYITQENINKWANQSWIDLRPQNMQRWQEIFQNILKELEISKNDTSSKRDRDHRFWLTDDKNEIIIDPGEIVGWILFKEGGEKN